ncbi:MAG: carboxypeptidase regulatory-like domain-containing protein, partial [Planctomycetes bacterium]|nr:carboxypeptidase regulatory-like domain-containing protein [Planctomycetota bacterium]
MNASRPILVVLAIAQAVAIVLLGWHLFGGTQAAAAPRSAGKTVESPVAEVVSPVPEVAPAATQAPASDDALAPAREGEPKQLPIGVLLHGTVSVADGGSLPGYASLSLYRGGQTKPLFSSNLRQEQTSFAWPDLEAGDYQLRSRAEGMRDWETAITVPEGVQQQRVDVVLEPSWLVKVLLQNAAGTPLHEALATLAKSVPALASLDYSDAVQVIALWHEIPDVLPRSELRSSPMTIAKWKASRGIEAMRGGNKIPARYAGVLEMPERRAAYAALVFKEVVLARAQLQAGQEELQITVEPETLLRSLATVRVQIVDADRKPLSTAKVGINDTQSWRQPTAVDAEGRVELGNLVPGLFRFSVQCEGYNLPSCNLELAPGSVTDLGSLVMSAKRELLIEVEGASEGDELRGSLTALQPMPHASLSPEASRLPVKAGVIKTSVAEGRYRLVLTGAGGVRLEFDTRTLGDAPLRVKLQPEATITFDSTGLQGPTQLVVRSAAGTAT